MKEILASLLYAVLTAALPVLAGCLAAALRRAGDRAETQLQNGLAAGWVREITASVADAVAATSQTYVDALKKAGKFDEEAQREAQRKAFDACVRSLSAGARAFIARSYGDLEEYLTTKIEAEVRAQKA